MKAMILAAGRGTRLRPLTDYQPKALVKVAEVPLLELVIRRLIHFGCRDIVVNVHHFGEQIIQFLQKKEHFGINIQISDEQDVLLDTGGALKKAASFFDDTPFLLCNTDILSNLDLRKFYDAHCQSNALATLAVQWRETSRYFMFDDQLLLNGWTNTKTGVVKLARQGSSHLQMLAFSGLHVIDPRLFDFMPEQSTFSIVDTYLQAAQSEDIRAFRCDDQQWLDVGKPSSLEKAEPLAQELLAALV